MAGKLLGWLLESIALLMGDGGVSRGGGGEGGRAAGMLPLSLGVVVVGWLGWGK